MRRPTIGLMIIIIVSATFPCTVGAQPEMEGSRRSSGIVFFPGEGLQELKTFYVDTVGCDLWLDQGSCIILRFGGMLFGFCESIEKQSGGLLTFFFEQKQDVDRLYRKLKTRAEAPPRDNPRYRIYHFYARDPEGRSIEFQHFLHPVDWKLNPGKD